jgi:hypothetical protein
MRARALIVSTFAAALLIGGAAHAQNTGAGMPAGKATGGSIGAPASLGPVGGSSLGAQGSAGFGAATRGDAGADASARGRIDAELRAARERMETNAKGDARLGLDAAAAQRAQSR